MTCFPELTYSIYADGELAAEEARAVQIHLAGCARCRERVEALRAENRMLAVSLAAPAAQAAPARAFWRPLNLAWSTAALLLVAAGIETVATSLAELESLPQLDWLNPLGLGFQSNLFFTSFFYVQEGGAMLLSAVQNLALLLLGVSALAGGLFWLRRRAAGASLLLASLLLALAPRPAQAFETRAGKQGNIVIAAGETIHDALGAAGATVTIDGTVDGDAFLFAESVRVRGTIKGNLVCFARSVDLEGQVEGTVACFGQAVSIGGSVARSLYAFAQMIDVRSGGRVEQDATLMAQNVEMHGTIGRHLRVAGQRVALLEKARVGGNLTVDVPRREFLEVASGAVAGKTDIRLPKPKPRTSRYASLSFYFWELIWLAAAFLTGLLLRWLAPSFVAVPAQTGIALLRAAGIGFLLLVATPVALLLMGITILGLPVALLGLAAYLAALYLAKLFVGLLLGQRLLGAPNGALGPFAAALLAGLAVIYVAVNLPYVGGVLGLVTLLAGLGIAFAQARRGGQQA